MSTENKTEIARINGAKSNGPLTPEGKLRSSQNAVKHGLLGRAVVLRWESQELFDSFHESFRAHYQPENDREACLVEELVAAKWRLRRLWGIETRLLAAETDSMQKELEAKYENIDLATRIAFAFESKCDGSRSFSTLYRYEARLLRAAAKAEDKLDKILEARARRDAILENCTNEPTEFPDVDH
jgi:hypothetical protein